MRVYISVKLLLALACITANAVDATNTTLDPIGFEYTSGKLSPIYKMPVNNVMTAPSKKNVNSPAPKHIPLASPVCESPDIFNDAPGMNTMDWYDTAGEVGRFMCQSIDISCRPDGNPCSFDRVETVTNTYSFKVGTKEGIDLAVVSAKLNVEVSYTTAGATSTSVGMTIPPGVRAYQGFATKWLEARGTCKKFERTCCRNRSPICTDKQIGPGKLFAVNLPKAIGNCATSSCYLDGILALCTDDGGRQDCNGGNSNMSACKASDTLLPGDILKGCTDDHCTDNKRMLSSSNNGNRVAIHTSGTMCIYGTVDGNYHNTACFGKSMGSNKGPFYGEFTADGNFCLYTKSGSNYWCTGSVGTNNGGYRMIMQNDGNLVIYTGKNNRRSRQQEEKNTAEETMAGSSLLSSISSIRAWRDWTFISMNADILQRVATCNFGMAVGIWYHLR